VGDTIFEEMQTQVDLGTCKFLVEDEAIPEGYQKTYTRMIFDVKQVLCHEGRYIIGGDRVKIFNVECYSSNMKDANGYDVHTGDIKNAYLNAFLGTKTYIMDILRLSGSPSNLSPRASKFKCASALHF
jgi:hypothetical protein